MKTIDTDGLARRYQAGESVLHLSKAFGVSTYLVHDRLVKMGVDIRDVSRAKRLRNNTPTIDDAYVVSRFTSGTSMMAIAKEFGVANHVIKRILRLNGHEPRSMSEAQRLRMARLTPEERLALSQARIAAVRGVPHSMERQFKKALAFEMSKPECRIGPAEKKLASMLESLGLNTVSQKAIGPYNIDLAITETAIAVEIFGGNWHNFGDNAAKYRKRTDYILNAGWLPVIVWSTPDMPLNSGAADYILALHKRLCLGKPRGRQEKVIRCDRDGGPVIELDPTDRPVVPSCKPPHRVRRNNLRPRK